MTEASLLPCPFCGGKPYLVPSGPPSGSIIRCGECSARTVSDFQGGAAKDWNTRVTSSSREAVIEECAKAALETASFYSDPYSYPCAEMIVRKLRSLTAQPSDTEQSGAGRDSMQKAIIDTEQPAQCTEFNFHDHLERQAAWSEKTFGPGARSKMCVDHIRKELCEIEADPTDLTEWIDVVILALDGAWRSCASPQEIIAALVAKQAKNEKRVWPDWRTADPTKAIEHKRTA